MSIWYASELQQTPLKYALDTGLVKTIMNAFVAKVTQALNAMYLSVLTLQLLIQVFVQQMEYALVIISANVAPGM